MLGISSTTRLWGGRCYRCLNPKTMNKCDNRKIIPLCFILESGNTQLWKILTTHKNHYTIVSYQFSLSKLMKPNLVINEDCYWKTSGENTLACDSMRYLKPVTLGIRGRDFCRNFWLFRELPQLFTSPRITATFCVCREFPRFSG